MQFTTDRRSALASIGAGLMVSGLAATVRSLRHNVVFAIVLAPDPYTAANQLSAVSALANSASRSASGFRPQVRTRSEAFVKLGA
jgi:hypothetical protein